MQVDTGKLQFANCLAGVDLRGFEICRSRTFKPVIKKWRCRGSNPVPLACKASALPFELHPQPACLLFVFHFDLLQAQYDKRQQFVTTFCSTPLF